MTPNYHLDYETASKADIKKVGGYRYANDPSTRILMFAIAKDDGDVLMWRFDDPNSQESERALYMFMKAIEMRDRIYSHNAPFELAVTRYRGRKDLGLDELPDLEQWRCVQAMARRAALPPSLKQLAETLKTGEQKDDRGSDLIQIFSVRTKEVTLEAPEGEKIYDKSTKGRRAPNRKSFSPIYGWHEVTDGEITEHDEVLWDWLVKVGGEYMSVRAAWELFIEYCRQDVAAEREIHKKLHKFELEGQSLASFQFNLGMNDRGVPVNIDALQKAQKLILQYQKRANIRFKNMTGLRPSQGAKFKVWLQDRGYFRDDLQAITVENFLDEFSDFLTTDALAALSLYKLLNFAALAKVPAMLSSSCDDGFVRGTMKWHGARTGRATGELVQPHNMKKATMETRLAYQMICDGCTLEDLEEFWESPLEVIASCARHFIHAVGRKMYDADFKQVEARIAPWVVGDIPKLDFILKGGDPYKRIATMVYSIAYEEVTKAQRTVSKPVELSCVFGTGGRGLRIALRDKYQVVLSLKECNRIVKVYRDNHPLTVEAWRSLEDAVKLAILEGKTSSCLQGRVRVGRVITAGMKFFVIQLPSGRRLYYPAPKIKAKWIEYDVQEMAESEWKAKTKGYYRDEIRFWGTRPKNAGWGWVSTYGSKLYENVVQSIGADLLDEGCISAAKAGFDIFMIVHDQSLCYEHPTKTADDFEEAFCSVGSWANDFPLAADVDVVPYYLKELD